MKFLVVSDIHGSAYYAEKIKKAFIDEKADKLIILGDVLYHGPRNPLPHGHKPNLTAEILNELSDKIICVRGNCDAEVDQLLLNFPVLCENAFLIIEDKSVLLTHGHKLGTCASFEGSCDVVISGHTHVQVLKRVDGRLYLNPGSVALPKENSLSAYILIDGKKVVFKDFDGNVFLTDSI